MGTLEEVFCQVLDELGIEWMAHPVSHVRNEMSRLGVLLSTNKLVANGEVTADVIHRCAPNFCSVYRRVMLRDIEESIESGDDE